MFEGLRSYIAARQEIPLDPENDPVLISLRERGYKVDVPPLEWLDPTGVEFVPFRPGVDEALDLLAAKYDVKRVVVQSRFEEVYVGINEFMTGRVHAHSGVDYYAKSDKMNVSGYSRFKDFWQWLLDIQSERTGQTKEDTADHLASILAVEYFHPANIPSMSDRVFDNVEGQIKTTDEVLGLEKMVLNYLDFKGEQMKVLKVNDIMSILDITGGSSNILTGEIKDKTLLPVITTGTSGMAYLGVGAKIFSEHLSNPDPNFLPQALMYAFVGFLYSRRIKELPARIKHTRAHEKIHRFSHSQFIDPENPDIVNIKTGLLRFTFKK